MIQLKDRSFIVNLGSGCFMGDHKCISDTRVTDVMANGSEKQAKGLEGLRCGTSASPSGRTVARGYTMSSRTDGSLPTGFSMWQARPPWGSCGIGKIPVNSLGE